MSAAKSENVPTTVPFLVSDYFSPTGFMGDGSEPGNVSVAPTGCLTPRASGAAGDCYAITYRPKNGWAGVYWQYPANNWGDAPGKKVLPGATKVRFWAASALGGETLQITAGGIADPTKPFHDGIKASTSIVLTKEWEPYEVDFGAGSYGDVIGAFSWSLTVTGDAASSPPIVFYLDGITWSD